VRRFIRLKTPCVLAIASLACACGSDDASGLRPGGSGGAAASGGSGAAGNAGGSGNSGGSGAGGSGGGEQVFEPPFGELEPGWNVLKPGRGTICARGTPFQYFVRPGTVNRLVIEFKGGGGCWSAETCAPGSGLFVETALADLFLIDEDVAQGIRDHHNAENPFKDWHHVLVPYCTGDVHGGDAEHTYESGGQSFTIHHKGAVNARAVLDWIYRNLPNPEKIMVTGCSAGSYGSGTWAPHVRNHYTSSKIYQFGDGGAGAMPDSFGGVPTSTWNAQASYPTFMPNFDPVDFQAIQVAYPQIGNAYPDMFMSMFNFNYDDVQSDYATLAGGGDAFEWSARMRAVHAEIDAKSPNYSSFIAAGSDHCTINYASFYSLESNGVRVVDWVNDVVNDVKVENVDCDPDCGSPR
jgi:hypothetical protein